MNYRDVDNWLYIGQDKDGRYLWTQLGKSGFILHYDSPQYCLHAVEANDSFHSRDVLMEKLKTCQISELPLTHDGSEQLKLFGTEAHNGNDS